ncbi:MAG: squalene/phytoene synthase family protein [Glycocaulis sp.]
MSADTFADTLRREDPARYLASLFAPAPVRANLWALYAFNAEIARIPASVSEAVIGEMRLAWAREALADLYARPPRVRRHPVYEALAILRDQPGAPDEALLAGLVEARNADLGEGAFPDAAERDAYIDRTAGTLMRAGARLCAPDWQPGEEAERALTAAVRLWGYTGLLRDFARLCAAGRPPVTQDELEASGASVETLRRGLQPEAAIKARQGLVDRARQAASELSAARRSLPAPVFPAIGYAVLARGHLAAARRPADPYNCAPADNPLGAQLALLWASVTGRV